MNKILLICDDTLALRKTLRNLFWILNEAGNFNLPTDINDLFEFMDVEYFIDSVDNKKFDKLSDYVESLDCKFLSCSVGINKKKNIKASNIAFDKYCEYLKNKDNYEAQANNL